MTRRDAFKNAALASALFGLPAQKLVRAATALPDDSLYKRDPEAYWAKIRDEQFLLPGWRAFLNNGSLGVAPKPVVDAVTDYLNRSAALTMDEYPRWGYEPMDEQRAELAEYLGCKKDELALTHNATEALSIIAGGIDLKAGDEVVMTDQEHPSGKAGWQQKQARYGISIREVKVPLPPKNSGQLADLMISAIGPRTRVLFFSGITTTTGLIFPIREICTAARAKGVITVVDGAHMQGQVPMRISEYGCDYMAGSPHKWLFAPAGSGILYIREENLDRLWPLVVTGGWDDKSIKAARFMKYGTNNRSIVEGAIAGLRFHKQVGSDRIYKRVHQLARLTYEKAKAIPYLELLTPQDDSMYSALVTVRFKQTSEKLAPLWEACKKKRIWTTQNANLRISTHIHTRPSDVDLFFDTVREVLG
jgi:isopenicillin-N epimerase